ncbi:MAG: hypothetical protein M1831_000294 [Alyxoria varia]|nr:MAG: hypothetical protein M1831_000294 [Alyxoria varia]
METSSSVQDRRAAPGLAMNLASNNPYRNATSPAGTPRMNNPPVGAPFGAVNNNQATASPRPTSTNPFLDPQRPDRAPQTSRPAHSSSRKQPSAGAYVERSLRQPTNGEPSDLLADLTLNDQSSAKKNIPAQAPPPYSAMPGHRVAHSQDDDQSGRPGTSRPGNTEVLDVFASPNRSEVPRPRVRRNSDSSILDAQDVDRRRRERRHRRDEREAAKSKGEKVGDSKDIKDIKDIKDGKDDKDGKSREGREGRSRRHKKPTAQLDVIDKLDVTGLYGPSLFHHDGPFDACRPDRNRKGYRGAPMQAFAEGSLNNAIGGSGPVHNNLDIDRIHGRGAEGFSDYNASQNNAQVFQPAYHAAFKRPIPERQHSQPVGDTSNAFNAKQNIEEVHGDLSAGLGTSTFLEGTPVSRRDLVRRESESKDAGANGGGLARKRSIAQKIRGGINRPRGNLSGSRNVTSQEGNAEDTASPTSPHLRSAPQSAGGRGRLNEKTPFFTEPPVESNAAATSSKEPGAAITYQATEASGRSRTQSSPNRGRGGNGIKFRSSEDKSDGEKVNAGGGFLGRMKSLKSKKGRPERFGGGGS